MASLKFSVKVPLNVSGWGPVDASCTPEKFRDIPYAPFSKADKLGRAADFYSEQEDAGKDSRYPARQGGNYRQQQRDGAFGAGAANAFNYVHAEDDSSFSMVDRAGGPSVSSAATGSGSRGGRSDNVWGGRGRGASRGGQTGRGGYAARGSYAGQRGGAAGGRWGDRNQQPQRVREQSIANNPAWQLMEEYLLSAFQKLSSDPAPVTDIVDYGRVGLYDKTYDRVSTKTEKVMRKYTYPVTPSVTASDDPVMQKVVETFVLPNGTRVEGDLVLATSQVMAALMAAPRSANGWEVIVTRSRVTMDGTERNLIVFDKRAGGALDVVTVHETSADPPHDVDGKADNINSPGPLHREAALADLSFRQNVVTAGKVHELGAKSPLGGADPMVGFRYRSFELRAETEEETSVTLFARTEIHAMYPGTAAASVTLHALTEHFPVDQATGQLQANYTGWRQKIDTQRGAVLATEIRNNSSKLCKWTIEALLADAEQMKIGFLTRCVPLNPARGHVLVGTQFLRPQDFSNQLNLNMEQAWGIFKSLMVIFLKAADGRYLLVKDANLPKVFLWNTGFGNIEGFDAQPDAPSDDDEAPQQ